MSAASLALDAGNITRIGVVVIVALLLAGVLLSVVITAIIARLVLLAVVVAGAILVWHQRTDIIDKVNSRACKLDATFFGVHLDGPQAVRNACRGRS